MSVNPLQKTQFNLRSYHADRCQHTHSFAQLVLPVMGSLELEIEHYSGIADSSVAAFIQPDEQHCFAASKENLFLVVDVQPDVLPLGLLSTSSFFNLTDTAKKFIQFTHFYLAKGPEDASTHFLIHNLLLHLVSEPLLAERDCFVLKAKNWIDLHFSAPINIDHLSRNCYLSASQLQRRFKRATGLSLAEYWRIRRIQQAKLLLLSKNQSIEKIAYQVGYENLSAFTRRFSQLVGLPPSEWRQKQLSAKQMRGQGN